MRSRGTSLVERVHLQDSHQIVQTPVTCDTLHNSYYFRKSLPKSACPWDKHGLVTVCACARGKIIDSVIVVVVHTKSSDLKIYVCTGSLHRGGNSSVRYIVMCLT